MGGESGTKILCAAWRGAGGRRPLALCRGALLATGNPRRFPAPRGPLGAQPGRRKKKKKEKTPKNQATPPPPKTNQRPASYKIPTQKSRILRDELFDPAARVGPGDAVHGDPRSHADPGGIRPVKSESCSHQLIQEGADTGAGLCRTRHGFVAHGTNAANLQPLHQAPARQKHGWMHIPGGEIFPPCLPRAPPPWPYSLSVEGVLARQHPQLLLHLKIFQTDGTGLLWEARRRVRASAETLGPTPTRNAGAGEIPLLPLLRCLFPGISSWDFSPVPKPPPVRGFPSRFPAQHGRSPAVRCRPRSACEPPSTPRSRRDVLQSIIPVNPNSIPTQRREPLTPCTFSLRASLFKTT